MRVRSSTEQCKHTHIWIFDAFTCNGPTNKENERENTKLLQTCVRSACKYNLNVVVASLFTYMYKYICTQHFYVRLEHYKHTKLHMIGRCRILPKNSDMSATCFDAVAVAVPLSHLYNFKRKEKRKNKSIHRLYLQKIHTHTHTYFHFWVFVRACECFVYLFGPTLCINQI